jgi:CTP synthase
MPGIIVARCDEPLSEGIKNKIAMFCNVEQDCVIENITVPVLYEAPLMLEKAGLSDIVCRELHLGCAPPDMAEWNDMLGRISSRKGSVKIALGGKYVELHDAYLSVVEALAHAGYENGAEVKIRWIDSEKLDDENARINLRACRANLCRGASG